MVGHSEVHSFLGVLCHLERVTAATYQGYGGVVAGLTRKSVDSVGTCDHKVVCGRHCSRKHLHRIWAGWQPVVLAVVDEFVIVNKRIPGIVFAGIQAICVVDQGTLQGQGVCDTRISYGILYFVGVLCGLEYHTRLQLIVDTCGGLFSDVFVIGIYSGAHSTAHKPLYLFESGLLSQLIQCGTQHLPIGAGLEYLW